MEKEEKIIELCQKIDGLEAKRKEIFEQMDQSSINDSYEFIIELNKIGRELEELENQLLLTKGPNFSNGKIDLYKDEELSDEEEETYFVTIHGSPEKIGKIRVTLGEIDPYYANIGYVIQEQFRGHHYTLQSLNMLRERMIEKGLTKPLITANPDNIASIKTIESFGGTLISQEEWNTYEVDLLKEEESVKK
ncbi:MAG: GNAT family N-acetyltransferase [Firmicutes bacterium]|nr:GNAT family N-acetyltransferase [Bacillota bacterium]